MDKEREEALRLYREAGGRMVEGVLTINAEALTNLIRLARQSAPQGDGISAEVAEALIQRWEDYRREVRYAPNDLIDRTISAIAGAYGKHLDAPQGEPVAWRRLRIVGGERQYEFAERGQTVVDDPYRPWEPLCVAPPAQSDVVRDAERYRYMRNNSAFQSRNGPGLYWYLPRMLTGDKGEQLDAAIDAALNHQSPLKNEAE